MYIIVAYMRNYIQHSKIALQSYKLAFTPYLMKYVIRHSNKINIFAKKTKSYGRAKWQRKERRT